MTKARRITYVLIGITCLLESACNPFMIFRPNSEKIVRDGWARENPCQPDPEPIYCYNSLGYKVCHAAPLEEQNRLTGYYGPNP